MIKNGRRGTLSGKLTVKGVQGHIAYPQLAKQPDPPGRAGAGRAGRASNGTAATRYFPPTSWQMSNIHAGTGAGNVIPGELVVDFNFRFSHRVDARVAAGSACTRCSTATGSTTTLAWTLGGEPFLTPPGALSEARSQRRSATETGIDDRAVDHRRHLATAASSRKICPQVVEFGPVNASIHKIDEHVARRRHRAAEEHLPPRRWRICVRMTLIELIERRKPPASKQAGVSFGHGTTNAFDEAAWLVLWRLGLPLDASTAWPQRELDADEQAEGRSAGRAAHRDPQARRLPDRAKPGCRACRSTSTSAPSCRARFIAELLADGTHRRLAVGDRTRRVLDLCTGNGSLAVLAAMAYPRSRVDAADISADALEVARINVDTPRARRAHHAASSPTCSPACAGPTT